MGHHKPIFSAFPIPGLEANHDIDVIVTDSPYGFADSPAPALLDSIPRAAAMRSSGRG